MAEEKRGGARPGSGRKATGAKTKHYTVNLPIEEAELLEKHAAEVGFSVNKYLRELIRQGGQYQIADFDAIQKKHPVDDGGDYDIRKPD